MPSGFAYSVLPLTGFHLHPSLPSELSGGLRGSIMNFISVKIDQIDIGKGTPLQKVSPNLPSTFSHVPKSSTKEGNHEQCFSMVYKSYNSRPSCVCLFFFFVVPPSSSPPLTPPHPPLPPPPYSLEGNKTSFQCSCQGKIPWTEVWSCMFKKWEHWDVCR